MPFENMCDISELTVLMISESPICCFLDIFDGSSKTILCCKIMTSRSLKYRMPVRETGLEGLPGKRQAKTTPARIVKIPSSYKWVSGYF